MGHYAKVENGIVTNVIVAEGPDWCEQNLGGEWIQTSYNTKGGIHENGKYPIHKNYAGIGHHFDGVGFYAPQPYPSFILNKDTYLWEAPTPMPVEEGKRFTWDEETTSWVEVPTE
jgi:hypothetical protein